MGLLSSLSKERDEFASRFVAKQAKEVVISRALTEYLHRNAQFPETIFTQDFSSRVAAEIDSCCYNECRKENIRITNVTVTRPGVVKTIATEKKSNLDWLVGTRIAVDYIISRETIQKKQSVSTEIEVQDIPLLTFVDNQEETHDK